VNPEKVGMSEPFQQIEVAALRLFSPIRPLAELSYTGQGRL